MSLTVCLLKEMQTEWNNWGSRTFSFMMPICEKFYIIILQLVILFPTCLFIWRVIALDENHHEFIFAHEAGFYLAKKRRSGQSVGNHPSTWAMWGQHHHVCGYIRRWYGGTQILYWLIQCRAPCSISWWAHSGLWSCWHDLCYCVGQCLVLPCSAGEGMVLGQPTIHHHILTPILSFPQPD